MTYYINPIWFYLMNVGNATHHLFMFTGALVSIVSICIFIIWLADGCGTLNYEKMDDDEKATFKLFKKIIIASIIALFIGILIPSKETCIEMMVASQVTHENVSATKEEIYEIVDYVTDKVKGEEE